MFCSVFAWTISCLKQEAFGKSSLFSKVNACMSCGLNIMTKENENYIRLVVLMSEGAGLVAKETLEREAKKTSDGDIDVYLKENTESVKQLKNDKVITESQYDVLFPKDQSNTDLSQWNASTLCVVCLQLFGNSLNAFEKRGLEEILEVRKKLLDIFQDLSADDTLFQTLWVRLTTAIGTLLVGAAPEVIKKGNDVMCNLYSGRFDTDLAMRILHKMKDEVISIKKAEPSTSVSSASSASGGDDDLPVQGAVRMRLKCSSMKGLMNVWEMVNGGAAQESLDKLSAILSEQVGSPITLQATINVNQFKEAVDSAANQLDELEEDKKNKSEPDEKSTPEKENKSDSETSVE